MKTILNLEDGEFLSASPALSLLFNCVDPDRIPKWIRIHKFAEYGSNLDLDPQHWLLG